MSEFSITRINANSAEKKKCYFVTEILRLASFAKRGQVGFWYFVTAGIIHQSVTLFIYTNQH
jgi:hypothetical protein